MLGRDFLCDGEDYQEEFVSLRAVDGSGWGEAHDEVISHEVGQLTVVVRLDGDDQRRSVRDRDLADQSKPSSSCRSPKQSLV